MTVQRSIAFQNARKSIGQTTYYRRNGVQMVRSKPTFSPGRTFTPAQLRQQYKMQVVQSLYKDQFMNALIPYMNCQNNKRYNASSRYNRFAGNVLRSVPDSAYSVSVPANEYAQEHMFQICRNMSVGNIFSPQIKDANYWHASGGYYIQFLFDMNSINSFLETASKMLKQKKPLNNINLGMCGIMTPTASQGQSLVINPTMFDIALEEDDDIASFRCFNYSADTIQDTQSVALVFFVIRRTNLAGSTPESIPMVCTSTIVLNNVYHS